MRCCSILIATLFSLQMARTTKIQAPTRDTYAALLACLVKPSPMSSPQLRKVKKALNLRKYEDPKFKSHRPSKVKTYLKVIQPYRGLPGVAQLLDLQRV